ncbi:MULTISPECIES: DUF4886 domain-containing protein [Sphingobacterium]|uniref:DUF4886 domain-containing protein n=1 Tax=Sphingobacterium tenebrionis TaxID=3111775 RepID=A0ABU8I866_9SPHI|nr:DUF4886 domain-containing protein [Sphingobacterium sp. CZ-2]QBR10974.1 DUF4886 domain-containing protein [Sphingobacterium sp. CZ-2]
MKKLFVFILFISFQLPFLFAQQISPKDDDVMKVLAIGNSFSEDGIENYLYDLAKAAGKKMVIGNLYIGGAPIELHLKNAHNNLKAYSYRKVGEDGIKKTTDKVSIEEALADDNWDYISLQQASPLSGKYNVVMRGLPDLWTYVFAHMNPDSKMVYHQTWAYQQDSKHEGFKNYEGQQLVMYDSIMNVTSQIAKTGDYEFVVPAGTAIQNARTSSIGDHMTRDGYHLNLDYGRFTAAATWYAKLFNLDPRKNKYKPEKITDIQAKIAKESAWKAVKKPFKITKVKK